MCRKRGFTLIELLVVIAIIALLVSILMPSLAKARELARQTACLLNMKTVGLSFMQYENDNNGGTPFFGGGLNDQTALNGYAQEASGMSDSEWAADQAKFGGRGGRNWAVAMWPYYKNLSVFICPSDPAANNKASDRYAVAALPDFAVPWGPGEAFVDAPRQSYYLNAAVTPSADWVFSGSNSWGPRKKALLLTWGYATIEQVIEVNQRGPASLYRVAENGATRSAPSANPSAGYDWFTANWGATYGCMGGYRASEPTQRVGWSLPLLPVYPWGATGTWEMHPRAANGGFEAWDSPDAGSNYLFMDGHAENRRNMPDIEESGCGDGI